MINMDSWHFWLYEKGLGYSFSKRVTVHHVNRCRYLKEILRGTLLIAITTMLVAIGIGAISLAPFVVFSWFMAEPTFMWGLTTVLAGVCLSIPVIAIKRRLWKRAKRVDMCVSFKELVLGYLKDMKKELCPVLTAKRLNR